MNIEEYWSDIDSRLENLLNDGFVKLPSLRMLDLENIASNISDEMGSLTFKELGSCHKAFLDELAIEKYLTPTKLLTLLEKLTIKGMHQKKEWKNSLQILQRKLMISETINLYFLLEIPLYTPITQCHQIALVID